MCPPGISEKLPLCLALALELVAEQSRQRLFPLVELRVTVGNLEHLRVGSGFWRAAFSTPRTVHLCSSHSGGATHPVIRLTSLLLVNNQWGEHSASKAMDQEVGQTGPVRTTIEHLLVSLLVLCTAQIHQLADLCSMVDLCSTGTLPLYAWYQSSLSD